MSRKLRSRLAALREGLLTFPEFVEQTCTTWENLAGYFYRRWPGQSAVDGEDLYQEILIATWAAVKRWDPERGVPIDKYVWYQAGVAATKTMKKTLRYSQRTGRTVWTVPLPRKEQSAPEVQSRVATAKEVLRHTIDQDGLESDVAEGVLDGMCLAEVARDLYADPVSRWRYWLGSEAEAVARVQSAARRIGMRSRTA
jgi:hypothetical protein